MIFPLVTVGITAYNCEDTISRAVESALEQDYPNIEIVIADDCSEDGTADIVQEYVKNNPNIFYYKTKQNGGVAASRNLIVEKAKGKFICFFDDDDVSMPNRVSRQYSRITEFEKSNKGALVMCHCAREHIYPNCPPVYVPTMGMDEALPVPQGDNVVCRTLTGKPIENSYGSTPTCVQMARASLYRQLGGFDNYLRRGEDTDLCIRAALAGAYFVGVKEPLVQQYMTLTLDKGFEKEELFWCYIFDKYVDEFFSKSEYDFCKKWMAIKFIYLSGKRVQFLMQFVWLFLHHPLYTMRRFVWALPSYQANRLFGKWRQGK